MIESDKEAIPIDKQTLCNTNYIGYLLCHQPTVLEDKKLNKLGIPLYHQEFKGPSL